MIYITGDTHGQFGHVKEFCEKYNTTKDDILIILGDAGLNFNGNEYDRDRKRGVERLPITIFAIHGNHEMRPESVDTYKTMKWNGGLVYYEPEFPSLLFAKDGEIFDLDGNKTIIIGGAYSVDKEIRLIRGWKWFEDEQPSDEIKAYVEEQLGKEKWKVDVVLSHTCPLKYEPVEWFMSGVNQNAVDKSTEKWLDYIENMLDYNKWYCGHYHGAKKIDKLQFMFSDFDIFYKNKKEINLENLEEEREC